MRYLETTVLPLGELTEYPGNPRIGDVPAIAASIAELGQYRSLIVRAAPKRGRQPAERVVLAGNHTRKALLWLAAGNRPPGLSADAAARAWAAEARCELIQCTDTEARKINLVDNRSAELGGYDDDLLVQELSYLDGDYFGTGWTESDVQRMIDPALPDGFADIDENDAAAAPLMVTCPQCSHRFDARAARAAADE